ncbi:hypothetical protein HJC23_008861 [Cyclotella cryptica]|uniref:Uncharacterized protein n=1 Tax=Cyclotella cryptica TaxID=29204 RepID=A0ABD3P590_9STRA|eukprot:CCRYP_017610-RA/>CCRYP_017610-RA protein AED:0.00 eAED:0.00 QI:147/-1/1/1/-1/1/1/118/282
MRTTRNAVKKAAKAKLSGFAVSDNTPKNKKVVFEDNDEAVDDDFDVNGGLGKLDVDINGDNAEDDDAVEEVKGSAARESTQKLREAERLVAKESTSKKKRTKKTETTKNFSNTPTSTNDVGGSTSESEGTEDMLTDDFFNMVDSERAKKLQLSKQEKKKESLDEKKRLGRHTTFVVEDDHRIIDVPKEIGQNIEVVAIGSGCADDELNDEEEKRNLLSARLGSASRAATVYARDNLSWGGSRERSCESRKRKSKDEESWKRSRKMVFVAGSGRAAVLFARRK